MIRRCGILLVALVWAVFVQNMSATDRESPMLAMVMLKKLTVPTEQQWTEAVHAWVSPQAKVGNFQSEKHVISFTLDGFDVMIGLMDAAISWRDLEGPAETSWLWDDAVSEIKKHQAHAIVILRGGTGTTVERAIVLTKLLATASQAFDAIGIYWGHGTVVLSRKLLEPLAKEASRDSLPILVWIEFRAWRDSDGRANVVTTGLDYFSCQEIEVVKSRRKLDDILNLVMNIAQMELAGDVFRDGDTVGPDAKTKIKTRHATSIWKRKPKVLRVEY